MRIKKMIIVPTSLYHYDLYYVVAFAKKFGYATVNMDEKKINLCIATRWKKHKQAIEKAVVRAAYVQRKLVSATKNE